MNNNRKTTKGEFNELQILIEEGFKKKMQHVLRKNNSFCEKAIGKRDVNIYVVDIQIEIKVKAN